MSRVFGLGKFQRILLLNISFHLVLFFNSVKIKKLTNFKAPRGLTYCTICAFHHQNLKIVMTIIYLLIFYWFLFGFEPKNIGRQERMKT